MTINRTSRRIAVAYGRPDRAALARRRSGSPGSDALPASESTGFGLVGLADGPGTDHAARTQLRALINAHIGSRIRALRLSRGKTQTELGDILGLTNQQVQKYEKGIDAMNLDKAWCTAEYFGVDIGYFLDGLDKVVSGLSDAPIGVWEEQMEYRRLRLALAEALHRASSPELLRSLLQLLRALGGTGPDAAASMEPAEGGEVDG
jgi:transcriptional regulator with XRE-family HTH domain